MSVSSLVSWLASLQLAGVIVLGGAAVADRLARDRSAATRRRIWTLALMLALTLPVARLALPAPALALPTGLAATLLGIWALGVGLLGLRWIHGIVGTRGLIRGATPIRAGAWPSSLAQLEPASAVELRLAAAIPGPMLVGGLRPVILIPAELALPGPSERRAILTHELAHLARADNSFLHLAVLVRAIYWITPLAWWSVVRLRDACEAAADDAVLEAGATPASYAAQLVAIARAQLDRAGRVAAGGLRGRVDAILDGTRQREPVERQRPSLAVARLLGVAVLLSALATACEARSDDRGSQTPARATMVE